jgi:hypothetical protein
MKLTQGVFQPTGKRLRGHRDEIDEAPDFLSDSAIISFAGQHMVELQRVAEDEYLPKGEILVSVRLKRRYMQRLLALAAVGAADVVETGNTV